VVGPTKLEGPVVRADLCHATRSTVGGPGPYRCPARSATKTSQEAGFGFGPASRKAAPVPPRCKNGFRAFRAFPRDGVGDFRFVPAAAAAQTHGSWRRGGLGVRASAPQVFTDPRGFTRRGDDAKPPPLRFFHIPGPGPKARGGFFARLAHPNRSICGWRPTRPAWAQWPTLVFLAYGGGSETRRFSFASPAPAVLRAGISRGCWGPLAGAGSSTVVIVPAVRARGAGALGGLRIPAGPRGNLPRSRSRPGRSSRGGDE